MRREFESLRSHKCFLVISVIKLLNDANLWEVIEADILVEAKFSSIQNTQKDIYVVFAV